MLCPWTRRLPMDTQAPHEHTGSLWTHRLPMDTQTPHGHTGCLWTHRLPMDTGSLWTHRLPMDTQAPHGHRLPMDTQAPHGHRLPMDSPSTVLTEDRGRQRWQSVHLSPQTHLQSNKNTHYNTSCPKSSVHSFYLRKKTNRHNENTPFPISTCPHLNKTKANHTARIQQPTHPKNNNNQTNTHRHTDTDTHTHTHTHKARHKAVPKSTDLH